MEKIGKELNSRQGDGIEVTLSWDRFSVCGETFVIQVKELDSEFVLITGDPEEAQDMYWHPFIYKTVEVAA